jgi:hypothetical protein
MLHLVVGHIKYTNVNMYIQLVELVDNTLQNGRPGPVALVSGLHD